MARAGCSAWITRGVAAWVAACLACLLPTSAWSAGDRGLEDPLFDLPVAQLLHVVVSTAGRREQRQADAPSILTVVSAGQIRDFGANSLTEVLERVTGAYLTGSFFFPQNVVSFRGDLLGHYDNHVLLLLNGRPLRESYGGGVNFPVYNAFPLEAIARLEIIRGPGSPLYGTNAYSGVINIITRESSEDGARVKITGGALATGAAEVAGSLDIGASRWHGGLRLFREDGWDFDPADNNGRPGNLDYGETNAGLALGGRLGEWTVNAFYGRSVQDFIGAVADWSGQPPPADRDLVGTRALFDVGHHAVLSDDWYVNSNLSQGHMGFRFHNYYAFSRDTLFETVSHLRIDERWYWLLGASWWRQDVGSAARAAAAPVEDFLSRTWEIYSQLDFQPVPDLFLYAGFQVNKPEGLDHDFVPRFGATWQFASRWAAKLLFAEAFRAPTGVETNVDIVVRDNLGNVVGGLRGNPDLEPERVENWDVQLAYQGDRTHLAVTLFRSRQENLVTRERAPDNILDILNRGVLRTRGVEVEGRVRFGPQTTLDASLSHQRNRHDSGVENFTSVPNTMFKLGLVHEPFPGVRLGVFDSFYSHAHDIGNRSPGRAEVNPDADAVHLVTANLRVQLSRWLGWARRHEVEAGLYAYNVLDADVYHPEFVGRRINTIPARPERSLYFNLVMEF